MKVLLRALALFLAVSAAGQDSDLAERVQALETENTELNRKVDLLAAQQETFDLGGLVPLMGDGYDGLGPAASKVYFIDEGLSIGGYGEAIYRNYDGEKKDQADLQRAILYFGYRFDENWVFNSEIEFEHASTSKDGSASVEFAYVDYAFTEDTHARAGLLLTPMGFLNELHEPQTFLASARPETERRIIPTTWRELGVGLAGDAGPVSYRAYLMNGFKGEDFDATGLRDGRQKGSKADAESLAVVARVDWTDTPGALFGGSAYYGNSGQDTNGLGATETIILEAHAEVRTGGWWARALFAYADVNDVDQLNAFNGFTGEESVGEELLGGYAELGYDVLPHLLPDSDAALYPFVRYEAIDTQSEVPSGFDSDSDNDSTILTAGLHWAPIDHVVIKADWQDFSDDDDRFSLLLGWAF